MTKPLPRSATGILTLRQLKRAGINDRMRASAVHAGELERLRNGWFALPGTTDSLTRSVRLGGKLSCISELERLQLWTIPDGRLHVAVAGNAARLRSPDDRHTAWDCTRHPDVRLHWRDTAWDPPTGSPTDSLESALARILLCQPLDNALVAIDSALNCRVGPSRLLHLDRLESILRSLPEGYLRVLDWVDPEAGSGLETLARLRLRRCGLPVRTQAPIQNVGFVDILIGERLVLELDSRQHHLGENYEKDRSRDLELFRQGFVVIRVSYRRVMHDWQSVESAILAAVRRGEHLRSAKHRKLGLALILR